MPSDVRAVVLQDSEGGRYLKLIVWGEPLFYTWHVKKMNGGKYEVASGAL